MYAVGAACVHARMRACARARALARARAPVRRAPYFPLGHGEEPRKKDEPMEPTFLDDGTGGDWEAGPPHRRARPALSPVGIV